MKATIPSWLLETSREIARQEPGLFCVTQKVSYTLASDSMSLRRTEEVFLTKKAAMAYTDKHRLSLRAPRIERKPSASNPEMHQLSRWILALTEKGRQ